MPYVRTVRTSSGATAVQIVYSYHRGSRQIEHIGSAHDEAELELLKAVARQRLAAGQEELDLGLESTGPARRGAGGGPLPITSTRMGHLLDALSRGYEVLGFGRAAGGDEVAHAADRVSTAGLARDLAIPDWSVDSCGLCQPRTEATGKPVTESNLSLRVPRAKSRRSAC